MKTKYLGFLAIAFLLFACNQTSTKKDNSQNAGHAKTIEGKIEISGAYALIPFIKACAEEFHKDYPGIQISITPTGSGNALNQLMLEEVDLALTSGAKNDLKEKLWSVAVAKTGIVMIMNSNNPYIDLITQRGLTITELQKVFTSREKMYWNKFLRRKNKVPVNVYNRSDKAGAKEILAQFLYIEEKELKGTPVNGEDMMIQKILNDPNAIGYCNINSAFDLVSGQRIPGLEFLSIDLNQNGSIEPREAVCDNIQDFQQELCRTSYPNILCRNLYIVANEKPVKPATIEFIKWILTKGQHIATDLGYSKVSSGMLKYDLYKLGDH